MRSGAARRCRSCCNLIQRRRRRRSGARDVRPSQDEGAPHPDIEYRVIVIVESQTHFLVAADTRYVDFDDHRWLYQRLAGWLPGTRRRTLSRCAPIRLAIGRTEVREHQGQLCSRSPTTGRSRRY